MGLRAKSALVTGAGGFIGSHLAEELVRRGADVTAFVRYNSRNDWGLVEELPEDIRKDLNVISGDLKDADAVRKACRKKDIVFHLGALIAIPYSYVNPRDAVETNVVGTLNVLMGSRESGVEMFIHTSTSEVYGTAIYTPIDEKHPLQGQSPYSASKIGADKIAESFYTSYDLPVVTIRPFNTYGPRQSARAVIPTIITQALTGEEIHIGSLTPKRDFTYVKDTVRGFLMAPDRKEAIGQVVNLGAGKEISIGELVDRITGLLGKKCRIIQDKERIRPDASEVTELLAGTGRARGVLGWAPETSLDDGLKSTIDYIKSSLSKYKTGIYNI
jgi:NAD dependent epimerase/dehydratase